MIQQLPFIVLMLVTSNENIIARLRKMKTPATDKIYHLSVELWENFTTEFRCNGGRLLLE